MATHGENDGKKCSCDRKRKQPPCKVEKREVRESESENQISSSPEKSIKLRSSDVLDCDICLEPLKIPIYQCNNGHVACSLCCVKLNKTCSFCTLPIGDIRCRALEKIIEETYISCPNVKYGCPENTVYGDSTHAKKCVFVPCSCVIPNCSYVGSYMDLKCHIRDAHSPSEDGIIPLVFDTPLMFSVNLKKKKMAIFHEENEDELIVVQFFKRSNGVYVTVSCIAPINPKIRNLSCSIAKLNKDTTLRLGLMVKKIQKLSEKMESGDSFMLIPSYMLGGDHLEMQICIGSEHKYINI